MPAPCRHTVLMGAKAKALEADMWALRLAPIVKEIRASGIDGIRPICRELNYRGVPTAERYAAERRGERSTSYWYPTTVKRLLERLDALGLA